MPMVQQAFAASLSWTMSHPWGTVHPAPVVTDSGGHTWLVAPDFGDGTITVSFSEALAGTLTLYGPEVPDGPVVLPPAIDATPTPPFENAVLIEVRAPGEPDRSGEITALGDVLWVGRAPGYLKRPRTTVVSGGQEINVKRDTLILRALLGVPTRVTPGAQWDGSSIVVDDFRDGHAVRSRFAVKSADLRATGSIVDSLRLELTHEELI
jgi:hypothetical protein